MLAGGKRKKSKPKKRRVSTKTLVSKRKKRPLNAYFKAMLTAKRRDADSFMYKGNVYVKSISHINNLVIYKRA